jgi:hypothetical protein
MAPGEYAVHYSHFEGPANAVPSCTIVASLGEAEQYAAEQVALHPTLRCRIYDHRGFIGAPIREVRGKQYVPESDITPRFRRWAGSILFFGGIILTIIDWSTAFKLGWPAMIGTRMMVPGFVLLFIEAMILLQARRCPERNTA